MHITDPVADMLTRIRNANNAKHETVDVPASNMKKSIAQILLDEGYIKGFTVVDDGLQGLIHITLANVDIDNTQNITLDLQGQKISGVSGRILTSASINDHNTFEKPDAVKPVAFNGAKVEKGQLKINIPAKSIVVLEVK